MALHLTSSAMLRTVVVLLQNRHIRMYSAVWDIFLHPCQKSSSQQRALGLRSGWVSAGKTSVARALAGLAGQELVELALNGGTDTSDLLGGFEQLEPSRRLQVSCLSVSW